jgi:large subunit ribosomal protein L14e
MIGRICVKLFGREAGRTCVIVDQIDNNFVLIDGNLKRRKCNINHLELTDKMIDIKKNASKGEVLNLMEKTGIKIVKPKESKKEIKQKPQKKRKSKESLETKVEDKKTRKNVKTKK